MRRPSVRLRDRSPVQVSTRSPMPAKWQLPLKTLDLNYKPKLRRAFADAQADRAVARQVARTGEHQVAHAG